MLSRFLNIKCQRAYRNLASRWRLSSRKSLSEYDEYCNIILQQDFDETKTLFTYYDVNGEAGTCPAEPNGFKRFLKEQTIYPAKVIFKRQLEKHSINMTVIPSEIVIHC